MHKKALGVLAVSLFTLGCVAVGARGGDAATGVRSKPLSPVAAAVQAQLDQAAREGIPAGISVDRAESDYLSVTVTARDGEVMALGFVPNEGSDTLRPVLPEGTEAQWFGNKMQLMVFLTGLPPQSDAKVELEPFNEMVALSPHDDVTIMIVNERVVTIALWQSGGIVGMYYAVDMGETFRVDPVEEDGTPDEGATRAPSDQDKDKIKESICEAWLDDCLNRRSEYWGFYCALWWYFCGSS